MPVHPESSLEAFQAVAATDFPIEFDLRTLADGTLVPLHDKTVNRTMTGIHGAPSKISVQEWDRAAVKNPGGGPGGTPTTWAAIAGRYGKDHILVPEPKEPEAAEAFIKSVREHGITNNVIVQTFDFNTAKELAAAGLRTLYLTRADPAEGPMSWSLPESNTWA